jgi:two-component system, sensor histidine kinase RegB
VYVLGTWVALAVGIVFFAIYTWRVAEEARRMANALTASQLALAREQQFAALGGLAAAAAHELGSPLGTIAVVSGEIARELPADSPIADDVRLLISETARCRDILAELSARSDDGEDRASPFVLLPLHALVQAAAERHHQDHVTFSFERMSLQQEDAGPEPVIVRSPEIIHGLGNIIQNAVQFARSTVYITSGWDAETIRVSIRDDGPGFRQGVLEHIGEPYISSRTNPGGHMGLGIFIASTLLRRSGAEVAFENERKGGARVDMVWRRGQLEARNLELST